MELKSFTREQLEDLRYDAANSHAQACAARDAQQAIADDRLALMRAIDRRNNELRDAAVAALNAQIAAKK